MPRTRYSGRTVAEARGLSEFRVGARCRSLLSLWRIPFTTEDVRGVCAIALAARRKRDLTAIGRFGIGFKSVYAITDRPEVHSGDEHFAVTDYVQPWPRFIRSHWPRAETVITLPLRESGEAANIARQFERLGETRALLFLREISEIEWSAEDGRSGSYRREEVVEREAVRRVTLLGEANGEAPVKETWLVFSRNVNHKGKSAGVRRTRLQDHER